MGADAQVCHGRIVAPGGAGAKSLGDIGGGSPGGWFVSECNVHMYIA